MASQELLDMYDAKAKLMLLIKIQEEQENGTIDEMQATYALTQQQVDDYNAGKLAEKQQLITELAAMMNAYLNP